MPVFMWPYMYEFMHKIIVTIDNILLFVLLNELLSEKKVTWILEN